MKKRVLTSWLALVAVIRLAAQPPLEYDVKAAYLLNFTKFIEWPAAAVPDGEPFRICVAGQNPFGDSLVKIVTGERVDAHPLVVQNLGRDTPAHCQIIFFSKSEKDVAETIAHLGPGVLTVGETGDFFNLGGAIRFVLENGRVRFDVNQAAARRAGLQVSSRLLKVARQVEGD